jgi:hypothetical protein
VAGKKIIEIDCGQLQDGYSRAMRIIMTSKSLDEIQGQARFLQAFNEHVEHCPLCNGLREEIDEDIRTSFFAQ